MYGMGDDPNELCVAAFQATFTGQFKDPKGLKAFGGHRRSYWGSWRQQISGSRPIYGFDFGAELFLGLFFSLSLSITLTLLLP